MVFKLEVGRGFLDDVTKLIEDVIHLRTRLRFTEISLQSVGEQSRLVNMPYLNYNLKNPVLASAAAPCSAPFGSVYIHPSY